MGKKGEAKKNQYNGKHKMKGQKRPTNRTKITNIKNIKQQYSGFIYMHLKQNKT